MNHLAIRSLCGEADQRAAQLSVRLEIPLYADMSAAERESILIFVEVEAAQTCLRLACWSERTRLSVDMLGGKLGYRQSQLNNHSELLKRASGAQLGMDFRLLDATAGLGTDTVMLAALGFKVTALERQPLLALLLEEALLKARSGSEDGGHLENIELVNADAADWLENWTGQQFDVIYLDPMFPERSKSAQVKKPMQLLQALLENDPDDGEKLLNAALEKALYRVVVKRPSRAPYLAGQKPSHQVKGSNIRFDIYGLRSMRAVVEAG